MSFETTAKVNYLKSPAALIMLALVVLGAGFSFFPEPFLERFVIGEGGPVENAQCFLYLAGAVLAFAYASRKLWDRGLSGGFVMVLFALRELDFHTRFTEINVTKTRFFISPEVPFKHKLVVVAVIVFLFVFLVKFMMGAYGPLMLGLRERRGWAHSAASGVALLPVVMALDGAGRLLRGLGLDIGSEGEAVFEVFEELAELAIPLLFLTALLQWGKSVSARGTSS
jgi:hypothetical protein